MPDIFDYINTSPVHLQFYFFFSHDIPYFQGLKTIIGHREMGKNLEVGSSEKS